MKVHGAKGSPPSAFYKVLSLCMAGIFDLENFVFWRKFYVFSTINCYHFKILILPLAKEIRYLIHKKNVNSYNKHIHKPPEKAGIVLLYY